MDTQKEPEAPAAQTTIANLPVVIHAQYVKDLSFENPQAPDSLKNGLAGPTMDVQIALNSSPKAEAGMTNLYEVTLRLSARATRPDQTLFIADLSYAGLVSLADIPAEQHAPLLLIEVPRVLFPFARQILAATVVAGGYPPLYLNPVDFTALYRERVLGQAGNAAPTAASA